MQRKYLGINRNRLSQFQTAKLSGHKRKNRFKKEEQQEISQSQQQTNNLLTTTTQNSVSNDPQIVKTVDVYEQAKQSIRKANQYKKKISQNCKLRINAFKQTDASKYDQIISGLSRKAIQHLLVAQKTLSAIRRMKGTNQAQEKYFRNMEKSLAQEVREMSKQLRAQQKQHYDRLKLYEKGTANKAIQLSETQKQKMRGDDDEGTIGGMIQQKQQTQNERDSQINQLAKSINKLSSIYKELNQLVIQQGSIIDRIDFNIQETLVHVEKGNEHLRGADEKASSSCAEKCMLVMISLVVILAIILGFKYSKQ